MPMGMRAPKGAKAPKGATIPKGSISQIAKALHVEQVFNTRVKKEKFRKGFVRRAIALYSHKPTINRFRVLQHICLVFKEITRSEFISLIRYLELSGSRESLIPPWRERIS